MRASGVRLCPPCVCVVWCVGWPGAEVHCLSPHVRVCAGVCMRPDRTTRNSRGEEERDLLRSSSPPQSPSTLCLPPAMCCARAPPSPIVGFKRNYERNKAVKEARWAQRLTQTAVDSVVCGDAPSSVQARGSEAPDWASPPPPRRTCHLRRANDLLCSAMCATRRSSGDARAIRSLSAPRLHKRVCREGCDRKSTLLLLSPLKQVSQGGLLPAALPPTPSQHDQRTPPPLLSVPPLLPFPCALAPHRRATTAPPPTRPFTGHTRTTLTHARNSHVRLCLHARQARH